MWPVGGFSGLAAAADPPEWIVACPFSHRASDDPIVFPGDSGASHRHDFLGNVTTDASSTRRSLTRGSTTCEFRPDRAAYWIPTVSSRGDVVAPDLVKVYYTSRHAHPSAIEPFPRGLKVVAGNAHAARPQSLSIVHWDCGDGGPRRNRNRPVDCGRGFVSASIIFPDCWDGERRDSRDHARHMAYSTDHDDDARYTCPRPHPVPIRRIKLVLRWPIHNGRTIELSSGSPITLHGDTFDAWKRRPLKRLIHRCLVRKVACGKVRR